MKNRPVTVLLIAVSVAWTAWVFLSGSPDGDWRRFGISNGYDVFLGDYWSLVASMFVHVNAFHLFFNAYWLYILGGYVEEQYGAKFYALLILISGCCASTLELSFAGSTGVGMSGVVYAIFGLLWGGQSFGTHSAAEVLPKDRIRLFLIWLVLCIVMTATGTMAVANGAHVAGLIVGLLAAGALSAPAGAARLAVPAIVLICGIAIFYSPWSYVWLASRAARAQVQKHWDVAQMYYSRMIEQQPTDPWPLKNRGEIRIFLGQETEGQADLSRAEQASHGPRAAR
ncbi:MAG: rhomboid family intramembrane serine protease [Chthoniobacter sp.]|uniref:rhomboid family intramembrane serine protease n=1 Tax=Chthoniobacter sp. TaxID=2510640 RepID=UPI0032A193CC